MSFLDWFKPKKPKPAPVPQDCPEPRQINFTLYPTDAVALLEPVGDHPVGVFKAVPLDPLNPQHVTFTIPGTVPEWGANWDVTAPTYTAFHDWKIIPPPGTSTEWPAVTLQPAVKPFVPAPREYAGNMCGIYVSGLPPVPGGSSNPALVLSWFYDRYSEADRARIREAWQARGDVDVLLSWPDSRGVGQSAEQFAGTCQELVSNGFRPCVMLCSKDYDPPDVPELERRIGAVMPLLEQVAPRICVGWELSLWLSPTQVQQLTDWLAPKVNPWGGKLYVHFQQGYASFQQPDHTFADYWNANIGKLTGLLHQRDLGWDKPEYQARLVDILQRFAGQFYCSPDSGFGHPFDCIALEITATNAFNDNMSEAEQNLWGDVALSAPAVSGPFGPVHIMGSGNGFTR